MNLLMGIVVGIFADHWDGLHGRCLRHFGRDGRELLKADCDWDVAKERLHQTTASIAVGWDRLKRGVQSL